jgi:hypothetical protein
VGRPVTVCLGGHDPTVFDAPTQRGEVWRVCHRAGKEEQLRRLRLANDERERRSIKLDEAELALSVLCGIVRSAFGAAPAQLARDFAGQQSAEAVINACLSAAADALGRLTAALREGQDPEVAVRGVLNAAWGCGADVPAGSGSTSS